ncbi:MAG: DUF192 domain-containing protein [Deltaproteobacteria bacterium]|nr:DUF192 domain-containing protein [Deltaproteobacteria bacterium]
MSPTFLSLALLAVFVFGACEKAEVNQQEQLLTPPKPAAEIIEAPKSISAANVVLHPAQGNPVTLNVEIARTPDERRQGLKGRESLDDNYGMWFVFEEEVQEPFWMKDTPVSLDLLFIDKDYRVVDFVTDATPNSELLIVSRQKFRYVLEVKAGSVRKWGLNVGDRAELRLGPSAPPS